VELRVEIRVELSEVFDGSEFGTEVFP
jgi:hypothetical protein